MISVAIIEEANSVVQIIAKALSGVSGLQAGVSAADLKYSLDDLQNNAEDLFLTNGIAQAIGNCFNLALLAGADIIAMENVRLTIAALTPVSDLASTIAVLATRCCLGIEVQIYANTTFTSREDVDTAIALIISAFSAAEDYAGDNGDAITLRSLTKARGNIVTYLNDTARPLPRMTTYQTGGVITSLTLAQMLYRDPARSAELQLENKVQHPAFMPIQGKCLSA